MGRRDKRLVNSTEEFPMTVHSTTFRRAPRSWTTRAFRSAFGSTARSHLSTDSGSNRLEPVRNAPPAGRSSSSRRAVGFDQITLSLERARAISESRAVPRNPSSPRLPGVRHHRAPRADRSRGLICDLRLRRSSRMMFRGRRSECACALRLVQSRKRKAASPASGAALRGPVRGSLLMMT